MGLRRCLLLLLLLIFGHDCVLLGEDESGPFSVWQLNPEASCATKADSGDGID